MLQGGSARRSPKDYASGAWRLGKVIYLKERSLAMVKNDLIVRNPLRMLGTDNGNSLKDGEFGGVLARSGVGKTSFLVQLALDSLLNHKNVLHISLDQPVKKVCLWYEEVFQNISNQYRLSNPNELWETILPHRFIMTFGAEAFSVKLLEDRLNDITEQGIFFPQVVLIDGLPFDEEARETLTELKMLAKEQGFPVWFTIRSHRDEALGDKGLPATVENVEDLFEILIRLHPVGRDVDISVIKAKGEIKENSLVLDPATLLIKDRG